eukprot:gb/GECG01011570.1/.p1 GENE.gb/GECG01011570.1/~~gb/GECG01011570.1/.p1  ORF type:complete len:197 (+),score=19.18 gb/GECG01011570.1/:1-591(+)
MSPDREAVLRVKEIASKEYTDTAICGYILSKKSLLLNIAEKSVINVALGVQSNRRDYVESLLKRAATQLDSYLETQIARQSLDRFNALFHRKPDECLKSERVTHLSLVAAQWSQYDETAWSTMILDAGSVFFGFGIVLTGLLSIAYSRGSRESDMTSPERELLEFLHREPQTSTEPRPQTSEIDTVEPGDWNFSFV